MMAAVKLIPELLAWTGIVLILVSAFRDRRFTVTAAGSAGFAVGVAGVAILLRSVPGDLTFGIIRDAVGASFLLLWGVSVAAIYRSTSRDFTLPWGDRAVRNPLCAGTAAFVAGIIAGAVCACRVPGTYSTLPVFVALAAAAATLAYAVLPLGRFLPPLSTLSPSGITGLVVALLLFSSSSVIRLDLFSPLTMKVIKFAHDFVHQFFESMLIPDHLFIRSYLWGYIGLLFSNGVGFWGAMLIWFTPPALILLAIRLERLPSVAHIRQGAQRRRCLAAAIRGRRLRLVVPGIAVAALAAAAYRSLFPSVEYWDPKPLPISASAAGEIVIPKKGEVDLYDGKLHKYFFKNGGREARFFVLLTPQGKLTVDLDACAICKPDGYGQAEGTVICYYCKTLIPLETVGKPGGCNPVPVPFTEKADGVHIDGITLVNTWGSTVQSTTRIKESGK